MSEPVVQVEKATLVRDGRTVFAGLSWTVREGESWAVVGPTGSGKTALAEALLGRHHLREGTVHWPLLDRLRNAGPKVDYPSQVIALVTFKEESRLFSYVGHYYQQRFEFADEEEPFSLAKFLETKHASPDEVPAVAERLGILAQLSQPFMTLSNGQTRRARLARALLGKPELLILDDPFIGLDATGRQELTELLGGLVRDGRRVVLICREDVIPNWVTKVMRAGTWKAERPTSWSPSQKPQAERFKASAVPVSTAGEPIVELNNVSVVHSGKAILDRVSWTVRSGERWAVVGPNGSGKTTLLSLLCGDHPQAYSNDIRLFGRQRGSGETIWDVKRNVGLLSPEFHLYFTEPLTAERTAATGFFDTVTDRTTTPEQTARVRSRFAAFGISPLQDRAFRTLSTGEQRLVLLVRALVKQPKLLILDEPFQGLDRELMELGRAWLDRELGGDQTLLFVTHDLEELPRCVGKLLRLSNGRVAEMA
jgi:molybdate transport system ATP-binding protein